MCNITFEQHGKLSHEQCHYCRLHYIRIARIHSHMLSYVAMLWYICKYYHGWELTYFISYTNLLHTVQKFDGEKF